MSNSKNRSCVKTGGASSQKNDVQLTRPQDNWSAFVSSLPPPKFSGREDEIKPSSQRNQSSTLPKTKSKISSKNQLSDTISVETTKVVRPLEVHVPTLSTTSTVVVPYALVDVHPPYNNSEKESAGEQVATAPVQDLVALNLNTTSRHSILDVISAVPAPTRPPHSASKCKPCSGDHNDTVWAIEELELIIIRCGAKPKQDKPFLFVRGPAVNLYNAFVSLREYFERLAVLDCIDALPSLKNLYAVGQKRHKQRCPMCRMYRDECEEEMCAVERLLDACSVADIKDWRKDNFENKSLYRRIMRVVCRLRLHIRAMFRAIDAAKETRALLTFSAQVTAAPAAPAEAPEPVPAAEPQTAPRVPAQNNVKAKAKAPQGEEGTLHEQLAAARAQACAYEAQLNAILHVLQEHNIEPEPGITLSELVEQGELPLMVRAALIRCQW